MLNHVYLRFGSVLVLASTFGACNALNDSNSQYAKGGKTPASAANASVAPAATAQPASASADDNSGHLALTIPELNSADGPVSKIVVAIMPAPACWARHGLPFPPAAGDPGGVMSPGVGTQDPSDQVGVATPDGSAGAPGPTAGSGTTVGSVSTTTQSVASLADPQGMGDGAPAWDNGDDGYGPNQWGHRFQGRSGLTFGPGCAPVISAVSYAPGVTVAVNSVPVGLHLILIAVIGTDGIVKEAGHGHVNVAANGVVSANVTVHPVNQTGSVLINIQEADPTNPGAQWCQADASGGPVTCGPGATGPTAPPCYSSNGPMPCGAPGTTDPSAPLMCNTPNGPAPCGPGTTDPVGPVCNSPAGPVSCGTGVTVPPQQNCLYGDTVAVCSAPSSGAAAGPTK